MGIEDLKPEDNRQGFALPGVYVAWLLAIAALYPACRWYLALKRRSSFWLLGYV